MRTRLLGLALIFLAAASTAMASVRTASGLRLGQNGEITRFVVDISESVPFEVKVLGDPDRAVVLLPQMRFAVDPGAGEQGQGVVRGFRVHVTEIGSSVVLDLNRPVSVLAAFMIPPRDGAGHRLVVDLKPQGPPDATSLTQLAALTPPPPLRKPPARRVVVLDAGHGGIDPGAVSAGGFYEKEITLAMAQEMRRKLLALGRYTVVMTRDSDVFLSLAERVRAAREAQADLFVSIHADSIGERAHRGGTVYTLSQTASDKEAEALAARENKADIIVGVDFGNQPKEVMSILIDLAQRETMNLSAQFAQHLSDEMRQRVPMNRNAHRFAGFRVLSAPDVPSVLVELGYLSNPKDEAIIRSPAGRAKFAEALAEAVDRYFATLAH
ncbi:N-acetylmuramoyl-L-alanine amidase [Desertibaculum subflavum]|uniref:N-acetylmuramoyl-L-alanine amidase n=1 Tax=Desertibaculum subflavum TaxID=2268458 RepID=UPI000E674249